MRKKILKISSSRAKGPAEIYWVRVKVEVEELAVGAQGDLGGRLKREKQGVSSSRNRSKKREKNAN